MSVDSCKAQMTEQEKYYANVNRVIAEKTSGGRYKKEYWQNDKRAKLIHDLTIVEGTFLGAAIGGTIGCGVGGACGIPGGPPGIAIGMGVGLSGGMAIGGGLGALVGNALATNSSTPKFEKWCKEQTVKDVNHHIGAILDTNEMRGHLICPISQMPIINPVITPQGQRYEKYELMEWVDAHGTDPMTREPLSWDDVVKDPRGFEQGGKKLYRTLKAKLKMAEKYAPEHVEGMKELMADIKDAAHSLHQEKMDMLSEDLKDETITLDEYKVKQAKYTELYFNL